MKELSIVLGLIEQGTDYLLQFRSGDPKIGAANLIGCFGGKIEPGEDPVTAVCRELAEETSLKPAAKDFEELGTVRVIADYKLEDVRIKAHVFRVVLGAEEVLALEGQLIRLSRGEIAGRLKDMTPGTQAVFKQFVLEDKI